MPSRPPATPNPQAALERLMLKALRWEWGNVRDYLIPRKLHSRLREPAFALTDAAAVWGDWCGHPVNEIRIARRLVFEHPWHAVVDVLRHEMAHQAAEQLFAGAAQRAHGPAFQRACDMLRVRPTATAVPDAFLVAQDGDAQRGVSARIRKLMALAGSPNRHEAEAAAAKAYALAAKHNARVIEEDRARDFFSITLGQPVGQRPLHRKMLANLLREFYAVGTVWVRQYSVESDRPGMVLEISGTAENIAMAQHVHTFVEATIERGLRRRDSSATTHRPDRRSYAAGVVKGFHDTLDAQRRASAVDIEKPCICSALLRSQDVRLAAYVRERYPHLRSDNRSHPGFVPSEFNRGRREGQDLVVHRPLHHASRNGGRCLTTSLVSQD